VATLKGFLSVEAWILSMLKGVRIEDTGKDEVCVWREKWTQGEGQKRKKGKVGGSHALGFFESFI